MTPSFSFFWPLSLSSFSRCPHPRPRLRLPRERGVAIITALVVVAAATVAISTMLWHQSVALRKADNRDAASQARWLARGAIDWARVVLREDARLSGIDHPGEAWATPLPATRINAGGAVAGPDLGDPDSALVSGRIVDAQARYNLTNLTGASGTSSSTGTSGSRSSGASPAGTGIADSPDGPRTAASSISIDATPSEPPRTADPPEASGAPPPSGGTPIGRPSAIESAVLTRLLVLLGQSPEQAAQQTGAIVARMLRMPRPERLEELSGTVSAETLAALRPHVVILPRATPLNLNTAAAEVLAARFENLPLDRARALVDSRRRAWFNQVTDAFGRLPDTPITAPTGAVSTMTEFFEIGGMIRLRQVEVAPVATIERGNNGATRILQLRGL